MSITASATIAAPPRAGAVRKTWICVIMSGVAPRCSAPNSKAANSAKSRPLAGSRYRFYYAAQAARTPPPPTGRVQPPQPPPNFLPRTRGARPTSLNRSMGLIPLDQRLVGDPPAGITVALLKPHKVTKMGRPRHEPQGHPRHEPQGRHPQNRRGDPLWAPGGARRGESSPTNTRDATKPRAPNRNPPRRAVPSYLFPRLRDLCINISRPSTDLQFFDGRR